ncbi:MAG: hypothetical protein LBG19_06530 [Prevotellaceae bacterium]|jgi:hypothetical protein|nr:hypothetical protein [Prevotellaceae bacterium]
MNLKKIFFASICLVITINTGKTQNIVSYNAIEKSLFPSKGKEILAAHGDTLMLINSLTNRKELWIYRPSTDSIEKHKAEIFYKSHLFNFARHSLAFYDVLMNRFIFSKLENGILTNYMGDKLKGVGEESIGLSLPRFYFFNNHWLILSLAGYAYMDNKLFYGYLTVEGTWTIPPQSIFEYPDDLTQSFGLVKAYAATTFNGRQLICSEVSGNHPIAKENNQPNGLFVLTELSDDFTVSRHMPIINQHDSTLLGKEIPSIIELLDINERLALTVKKESSFYVKVFGADFKLIKQLPITEGISVTKHTSIPIAKGFITTYSTSNDLSVVYIVRDGTIRKRWKIHSANMNYVDFYCMKDKENFYVIINDKQANEIIRKTIPLLDLEK